MFEYPEDYDETFRVEIAPDFWLMDHHKWAFYIWAKNKVNINKTLLHLDYHWDGVNDFHNQPEISKKLKTCDLDYIEELMEERYITSDSFIAPAIIANIFNEVHFLCYQKDTEIGLYSEFIKEYKVNQFIHKDIDGVVKQLSNKRIAFDLDIDIFNHSEYYLTGDLWQETEIIHFLEKYEPLIKNADIITVAMSYGYSGTKEDTHSLTELVVNKIMKLL